MSFKDNSIFIKHILESINNIETFIEGVSKNEFLENIEKQSAIIRQIEIIGEAAKNLSSDFRTKYKPIQWKEIIGTRDKIIHNYFGVDLDIVWDIIKINLPELKQELIKIKSE